MSVNFLNFTEFYCKYKNQKYRHNQEVKLNKNLNLVFSSNVAKLGQKFAFPPFLSDSLPRSKRAEFETV